MKQGAMGMSIKPGFGTLHGVILWGCDIDESGKIKAIYFTDSEDLMPTPNAPRVQILHHLEIVENNGTVNII